MIMLVMRKMNTILDKYKRWVAKLNQKQRFDVYSEYFQPYFKYNPFDTRNDFVYDFADGKLREFIWGFQGIGYAWKCWSCLMRDKKYSYFKFPDVFWSEINDGWLFGLKNED